jgi:enoyl-[acyl-carrier protein] reductase I
MSFLELEGKKILVMGVSNKKSVAFHVGKVLTQAGAEVIYSVRTPERREEIAKRLPDSEIFVCDVEKPEEIERLAQEVGEKHEKLNGFVHSIAFANYADGFKPFHETKLPDFLQAVNISCFSFVEVANAFKDLLTEDASCVAISISTTTMAAENYGYMAPIKAALDSATVFLAKSFSGFSRVRFNTVRAGLLKTRSSAGIPGYAESYLFAEKVIPRGKGLSTPEVANTVAFLLSSRSSGINAQGLVVDAGMSINYFDKDVVHQAMRPE